MKLLTRIYRFHGKIILDLCVIKQHHELNQAATWEPCWLWHHKEEEKEEEAAFEQHFKDVQNNSWLGDGDNEEDLCACVCVYV